MRAARAPIAVPVAEHSAVFARLKVHILSAARLPAGKREVVPIRQRLVRDSVDASRLLLRGRNSPFYLNYLYIFNQVRQSVAERRLFKCAHPCSAPRFRSNLPGFYFIPHLLLHAALLEKHLAGMYFAPTGARGSVSRGVQADYKGRFFQPLLDFPSNPGKKGHWQTHRRGSDSARPSASVTPAPCSRLQLR